MAVDREVMFALEAFPEAVRIRLDQVNASEVRRQTAAGDFALVEHLCHLRDYDVEGCQERIRRMLLEDAPSLPDYDGARLAVERKYIEQDAARAVQEFANARRATLALLNSLSHDQLARRARFGSEEITVRDLAGIVAAHDATHLAELDALLAEVRATRTGAPDRPAPRLVAVAVARDSAGRVLLCRMPQGRGVFPGLWSLPGGGVEPGESLVGALAREVREELGVGLLTATPRLFKDLLHEKTAASGARTPVYMVFQVFECTLSSTDVTLSDEFTDAIWATPSDLAGLQMSEVTRATLASVGIAPDDSAASADASEILAAIAGFREAYESGDLARVAGYYCDDVMKLRQGAAAEGKDVLLERVGKVFESYERTLEVENEEVRVRGDLAVIRGRFEVRLTPRSPGEPVHIARRFLEVWCRHGGRWAVCRTMDNSDQAIRD